LFIRKAMNIDIKLIIGWVNAGGHNPNSPAWVELPAKVADMPYHGTEAFKSTALKMFFRKSFLEAADYDEISMAIAHELSHAILASLRSPLWEVEKAVDLAGMILGFRLIHKSACYRERRSGRSISYRTLGYLSRDEVDLANRVLEQQQRSKAQTDGSSWVGAYRKELILGGSIAAVIALFVLMPDYTGSPGPKGDAGPAGPLGPAGPPPPAAKVRTFDAAQLPPPIPPKVPRGIPTDPQAPPTYSPQAPQPPIMKGQTCAAITDLLNLRTGPGTQYPVITALPLGSIVFLLEEKTDNWQHVATTAGGGWVFRSYIQPVQCPPPPVSRDVPPTPAPVPND
jgi:hypothetical protein